MSHRFKTIVALGTLYLVWGSTYLAIRVAVETIPPATLGGSRFLTAGLATALLALAKREPRPARGEWMTAAAVGIVMLLGGNGLVCWAEQYVASGLAALIICSTPLWLLSMEAMVPGGEKIGRRDVAALLVGLAGVALLVSPQLAGGHGTSTAGAVALLAAAASWSLGSTVARHAVMPRSIWVTSAVEMLAGGGALLLVAWLTGELGRFDPSRVSAGGWLAWGYLVIGGSLLAFSAYGWLVVNVRPTLVTTYAYVNPVVAVILGVLFLGETMSASMVAGAAVTLASVVMVTRRKKPPAAGTPGPESKR